MNYWKEPQAHHWVVLRLLRELFKSDRGMSRTAGLSTLWLIRELSGRRVVKMIRQLEKEEA